MRRAALAALLSHWRRRPFQLATLVLGLALATALWTGVQAINAEARASYDRAARAVGGDRPALVPDSGTIPVETYVALRRAGWLVTPVVEGWISGEGARVRLVGLDPLTAPPEVTPASAAFSGDVTGFLTPPGRLLAAPETARRLTLPDLPPVTAAEGLAPGMAFADIGVAQRLLGLEGQVSRLILLDNQPLSRPPLEAVAPGLTLRQSETGADLARLTDSFHLNLTAFGLLSFVVGLFIVHGAIGLAFEQRRPLFRTLRALGLPARTLTGLAIAELLAFALLAGALGVFLGYGIAAALIPDVAATLRGLYGVPVEGALSLRPAWWAMGLAIAVLGTAVAGAGAIWKLARLPVLAPARPRAWALASLRTTRAQALAAVLLALAALAIGLFGTGLVAGFAMLGALLLAAALALPLCLTVALALLGRTARSAEAEWFWADTRQQLPGLSLALMALLLALATNIGVGTMVSSFRLTFIGWLDQRFAAELYVAPEEGDRARLAAWLAPRTDAVLSVYETTATVLGAPGEIVGLPDHATYRDNWTMLAARPGAWDVVADGTAVLINEQLAYREDLRPGDAITLPGPWETVVAGIYSDYGNPKGQVLINAGEMESRYPEATSPGFALRVPPTETAALTRALTEDYGLPPGNLADQAALKRVSRSVFERTFTVTGALNVLTLMVAGFAILTSLLTLGAMRLPQLAPAWAVGLTRTRLARLELLRALLLALLTALVSVPVGLLLAWVLLAVINVEAFGWRLPMHVFPGQWAVLLALSLATAGLAALWPAVRLRRLAPATLLKVFTDER